MTLATKKSAWTDIQLLDELAAAEGYSADADGVTSMLEAYVMDSVVPGICTECLGVTSCEPDARRNWCESCGTNTVRSCFDIAGLI